MPRGNSPSNSKLNRFLLEPTVHFFLIAAAVLLVHRLVSGDAQTVVITPSLESDLLRRDQDQLGRPPTNEEAAAFIRAWKGEEALYREALRAGIDRYDPDVRNVLIGKMRERLLLQIRLPEPTESDLEQFLEQHRDQFETPKIYEHEYVVFPKTEPGVAQRRAKCLRQLAAGASVAALGLRSTVANVDRERIAREFGPDIAAKIIELPIGSWQELETNDRLLLVKMIGVQGGLPERAVLRERLAAGWQAAKSQEALAKATQAITDRYRFEERPQ